MLNPREKTIQKKLTDVQKYLLGVRENDSVFEERVFTAGNVYRKEFKTDGFVKMQDDGNLVIYRGDGTPLWESGSSGGQRSTKYETGNLLTGKIITFCINNSCAKIVDHLTIKPNNIIINVA